jgi:hypothetical protein
MSTPFLALAPAPEKGFDVAPSTALASLQPGPGISMHDLLTDPLDSLLEREPSGMFASMDETTRERYRRACRELAARSTKEPLAVVHEALRLCEERDAGDVRGRHVGTWLIAEGRPVLEARLGCQLPWAERAARFVRQQAGNVYLGTLLVLLALVLLGVDGLLAAHGFSPLSRGVLAVICVPVLLDFLQECLNGILSSLAPALEPLPRLEPRRVLSPDTRTLVITPLLVSNAEDIDVQLRMLEINSLGNVEPELFFALLTDFRDAAEPELPGERELLARLEQGIHELNERHGFREQPRYFLFHRERRWNAVAGRWMGWERKRGKLEELNRLILGAGDTSYRGPIPEWLRTVRYVITLDADTHLLPGDAARLVATLHHPLNRPCLDATGRRVMGGYSILQPRIDMEPTREHWLATGGWPLSLTLERKRIQDEVPWALQQRLFGIGDYLGKGIYDVAAFSRCLEGRLPENLILGHDKIEGMFARGAFVHDIRLFEVHPTDFMVATRIWHRWVRGDWQMLQWLLPWVPSQAGRVPNSLSFFERWRLLSALFDSLRYLATLVLLGCGWVWLPSGMAWAWTLGGLLWTSRRALLGALGQLVQLMRGSGSVGAGLRSMTVAVPRFILGALTYMGGFFLFAGVSVDAIARVLYRLAWDRSRMLDWTTYAQSSQAARSLRTLLTLPEVWGALGLSSGIAATLAVFNPWALPWAAPLLLSWVPLVVMFVRQGRASVKAPAPAAHLEQVRALARSCWELYARRDAEESQSPSPTDLALGLVAPLSAYHLGYVGLEEWLSRVEASLAAIQGRERHRGHLLVGARRICTKESGVLAAALLVVERGLQAARQGAPDAGRVKQLAEAARTLREGMDFGWLYDREGGLLHTGYDVDAQALERTHHGLLSSGAMLAGFVGIATRQVPLSHWTALTESDQRRRSGDAREGERNALAEELLPTLFVWFPPSTSLGHVARRTLEAEAATPRSVLALRFQPERAVEDLKRVAEAGHVERREQALALAAAANLTCDDILVRHFHQHWQTAWVEALVYE